MPPTIRYKYKYFHSAVQRAKDRRQKFHFCRLRFDVRPRNVKLNLSIVLLVLSGMTATALKWLNSIRAAQPIRLQYLSR